MDNQWNFMRLLRFGIAIWAFWQAFQTGEWILLLPGSIFGLQAVFNVGCCGSAGCYAPPVSGKPTDTEAVFEEVK